MEKNVQSRAALLLLSVLTLALCTFAFLNFRAESSFDEPTDGVTWREAVRFGSTGLRAERVLPASPAERAGIRTGDLLVEIDGVDTPRLPSAMRQMFHTGIYHGATYTLVRDGVRVDTPVILEPADRSEHQGTRLIALVYLGIGLYVLFRRWTAPRSLHFYVFCLVSFVLYSFHYTGRLDDFDWIIYWGNVAALAMQPALFLHFAATFPDEARKRLSHIWAIAGIYLPGLLLIGLHIAALKLWTATELLHHRLDQLSLGYLALYYVLAAAVLAWDARRENTPLRRQQLKWLVRGTLLAVTPFTVLYVIPFLADWNTPLWLGRAASLFLVFLPLTFSYAIVRYRLMDVDLIFKRGVSYTLATGSIVGVYFGVVAIAAAAVHTRLTGFGTWGLIITILVTAQIFDPLKRLIQGRVDKIFDRRRYDYRATLIEFGRGLSSETDINAVTRSLVDRLSRTLLVPRVAVFLPDDTSRQQFRLAAAEGIPLTSASLALDLGFLPADGPVTHTFFENTQSAVRFPAAQQTAIRALDLNYFIPCRVQQRTVAVLGLGRTSGEDFLTSEDVELLESLANYIGIAIQNTQLYASLATKIDEYERLKEFNENIVESINVGIFTVNLDDRIESWNAQMEVLSARPRADVLGRPLHEVFPAPFVEAFHRTTGEAGVHNLYKFPLNATAGELRSANVAIAPLLSRDFATVGRIVLVDDITDRVALEGQLAQAEKLSSIGLLAAGVAHEVNTPLAVISGYTQMLSKQLRGDERLSKLLDKITQQTFRASEITNGLLNFSRTSAVDFRDMDINGIIRETLTLLEHQFRKARVEVVTHLDQDLPPVRANQGKLQQVFLNLFLNAKDAMSGNGGGTLTISTRGGGCVTATVADSGPGIAPENLSRIYDPFFTTKTTPRDGEPRGTGLGLSVSYGIIQEHHGKITVDSVVGRGTTFELEFPTPRSAGATGDLAAAGASAPVAH